MSCIPPHLPMLDRTPFLRLFHNKTIRGSGSREWSSSVHLSLRKASLAKWLKSAASFRLSFSGLTCNEDGLYDEDEFMERLGEAIADYDELIETYEELAA